MNATKLNSLTFSITNEDNHTVNSVNDNIIDINATATIATAPAGGVVVVNTTGPITVNAIGNIAVNDSVYNRKNILIGVVTTVAGNTFTIGTGTLLPLIDNEIIYLSNLKTPATAGAAGVLNSTAALAVTLNGHVFNIGDKVYLGDGGFVGTITAIGTGPDTITFGGGIQCIVPNGVAFYDGPRVFNTNSSSNRMTMEVILISR